MQTRQYQKPKPLSYRKRQYSIIVQLQKYIKRRACISTPLVYPGAAQRTLITTTAIFPRNLMHSYNTSNICLREHLAVLQANIIHSGDRQLCELSSVSAFPHQIYCRPIWTVAHLGGSFTLLLSHARPSKIPSPVVAQLGSTFQM